jgi:hypothetical protein
MYRVKLHAAVTLRALEPLHPVYVGEYFSKISGSALSFKDGRPQLSPLSSRSGD